MKTNTLTKIEALCPLLFFVLFLLYYGVFTSLANLHPALNDSRYVSLTLDQQIPLIPYFVVPYLLISSTNPLFSVAVLWRVQTVDPSFFRRFYTCLFITLFFVFGIWYFFPVYYQDYTSYFSAHPEVGFWGALMVWTHAHVPAWNSFPSSHVILPWYFFRVVHKHVKKISWIFFVLFVLIALSTLFIKIHYIADVLSGWFVGELAYQFFTRSEKRQWLSNISSQKMVSFYLAALFLLALGLIPLGMQGLVVL